MFYSFTNDETQKEKKYNLTERMTYNYEMI